MDNDDGWMDNGGQPILYSELKKKKEEEKRFTHEAFSRPESGDNRKKVGKGDQAKSICKK